MPLSGPVRLQDLNPPITPTGRRTELLEIDEHSPQNRKFHHRADGSAVEAFQLHNPSGEVPTIIL
jgi:hypothetical protein